MNRPLWTAIAILAAAFIAMTAGLLTAAGGAGLATSILAGGGAFAGAAALILAVLTFLTAGGQS